MNSHTTPHTTTHPAPHPARAVHGPDRTRTAGRRRRANRWVFTGATALVAAGSLAGVTGASIAGSVAEARDLQSIQNAISCDQLCQVTLADSDGDGQSDLLEAVAGTDPLNAYSELDAPVIDALRPDVITVHVSGPNFVTLTLGLPYPVDVKTAPAGVADFTKPLVDDVTGRPIGVNNHGADLNMAGINAGAIDLVALARSREVSVSTHSTTPATGGAKKAGHQAGNRPSLPFGPDRSSYSDEEDKRPKNQKELEPKQKKELNKYCNQGDSCEPGFWQKIWNDITKAKEKVDQAKKTAKCATGKDLSSCPSPDYTPNPDGDQTPTTPPAGATPPRKTNTDPGRDPKEPIPYPTTDPHPHGDPSISNPNPDGDPSPAKPKSTTPPTRPGNVDPIRPGSDPSPN